VSAGRNVVLRPWRLAWFLAIYVWNLVRANAVVAWEIVTPTHTIRPGIVVCPTRARTDLELAMLANLISFTPGTLTLEVADDRSMVYVHALHIDTPDGVREDIRRLEDRLLWVLR
jgi:multicomponent Na+:H+ antiporter subunit E